jgi:hypothetical protein
MIGIRPAPGAARETLWVQVGRICLQLGRHKEPAVLGLSMSVTAHLHRACGLCSSARQGPSSGSSWAGTPRKASQRCSVQTPSPTAETFPAPPAPRRPRRPSSPPKTPPHAVGQRASPMSGRPTHRAPATRRTPARTPPQARSRSTCSRPTTSKQPQSRQLCDLHTSMLAPAPVPVPPRKQPGRLGLGRCRSRGRQPTPRRCWRWRC